MADYHRAELESGLEVSQSGRYVADPADRFHYQSGKEAAPVLSSLDTSHYEAKPYASRRQTSRNPFGLSPSAFGILVALITATILGAALGGGLGSAINSSSKAAKYV